MVKVVKDSNCPINRLRSVNERTIDQMKIWRVLHSRFQRSLDSYAGVFSSGAGVGFLCCFGSFMNKLQYVEVHSKLGTAPQ